MGVSLSRRQPLDIGHYGISREALGPVDAGCVDVRAWFEGTEADAQASRRPVELEIGSGKGTFLVQQAGANPHVNYLGLEYARAFWRYSADRARRHGLANVRVVHAEADSFVRHRLAERCLRQVHIYFPDPWPKKRHNRRRLVQSGFLQALHRVLEDPWPGDAQAGLVRLATDHADYFQWMNEHARLVGDLFEILPFARPESAGEGEYVGSNFERKYRLEDRPIHGMVLRKRPVAGSLSGSAGDGSAVGGAVT